MQGLWGRLARPMGLLPGVLGHADLCLFSLVANK